ncbi:MAG: OmpA family protein [Xanthomonadaceae bacterium]|nr:OmpA family protein [Xanthomonadaceae bacterium]
MFNNKKNLFPFVIALALTVSFGCSKKDELNPDENPVPTSAGADDNSAIGDSDTGRAMGLQTIHFPYDSYELSAADKEALAANIQILKDKSSAKIQVEGHCDQRGGIQYNLALGEKRANAVRKYMIDKGVQGNRITTISFGKEKLIDQGTGEDSMAKNRRANFVVTSR